MSDHAAIAERARAIGHPIRIDILMALDNSAEGMSPNQLSKLLHEPLGNVSYHVRHLLDNGKFIELVRTIPRRGAIEHVYRLSAAGRELAGRAGLLAS
jgi:DNA-binding transcriptional ArsR family regulator